MVCVLEINMHFCLLRKCNLMKGTLWNICSVKRVMNLQVGWGSWWLQQAAFKHEKYVRSNRQTKVFLNKF